MCVCVETGNEIRYAVYVPLLTIPSDVLFVKKMMNTDDGYKWKPLTEILGNI